jgi:hypothetical protein
LRELVLVGVENGLMNYIDTTAKCICTYRDFAAGIYLSEAQNPIPSTPFTLYTCIQYTYFHREGGKGVELNQREG